MAQIVRETFQYKNMTANATFQAIGVGDGSTSLGGFLCTTAGTLQVDEGVSAAGNDIVSNMAVVVGTFYPFPCTAPLGAFVTLAGGAAGTLFYGL